MTTPPDKTGFKKKIITFLLLTACAGCLIFLTASENNGSSEKEKRVKKGDFLQTVILTGSLKAQQAEELIVPYSNTWQLQVKWMVKEGDYVKTGDPVVRFDTANLPDESGPIPGSLKFPGNQSAP